MFLTQWLGFGGKTLTDDTVIKFFSGASADWKGNILKCDSEDHLTDVWCVSSTVLTMSNGSLGKVNMFKPCHANIDELRTAVKRGERTAYYISGREINCDLRLRNGKVVKIAFKFNPYANTKFTEWVCDNFNEKSRNYTVKDILAKLDKKFENQQELSEIFKVVSCVERADSALEGREASVTSVAELSPGAIVFGAFRVERELGAGGCGKLLLMESLDTMVESQRHIVFKILTRDALRNKNADERLVAEANTMAELNHDGIVRIYGCRKLDDHPIIAMEYVEGCSLDEYLRQHGGKLSETETKDLLSPIAAALDYIHQKGLFHLDIKPHNIMIRAKPRNGMSSCLLDFGIARREADAGMAEGTRPYMSPDQIMGESPCAAMDIYSLAVTAYECMSGKLPYPEGWKRSAPTPAAVGESNFAKVILRTLSGKRAEFPATCAELVNPKIPQSNFGAASTAEKKNNYNESAKNSANSAKSTAESPKKTVERRSDLKRTIDVYRRMLAQSANKIERTDAETAGWMRERQTELRQLTVGLANGESLDVDKMVNFFRSVRIKFTMAGKTAEDFFVSTVDLHELRAGLPKDGDELFEVIKESVGGAE